MKSETFQPPFRKTVYPLKKMRVKVRKKEKERAVSVGKGNG